MPRKHWERLIDEIARISGEQFDEKHRHRFGIWDAEMIREIVIDHVISSLYAFDRVARRVPEPSTN